MFAVLYSDINSLKSGLIHFTGQLKNRASQVKDGMEQRTLKNANNYLNTNIYSCLETPGGQSSNLYLNAVHFLSTGVN
jgi:hypothetical protein